MLIRNVLLLQVILLASFANADKAADRAFALGRKAVHAERLPQASQGQIAHHVADDIVARYRARKTQAAPAQPVVAKDTWSWSNPQSWLNIFSTSAATDKQKITQPVVVTEMPDPIREVIQTPASIAVEQQTTTATTMPTTTMQNTPAPSMVTTPVTSAQPQAAPATKVLPSPTVTQAYIPDAPITTEFVPAQVILPSLEVAGEYIPDYTPYVSVPLEQPQLLSAFSEQSSAVTAATAPVMVADIPSLEVATDYIPDRNQHIWVEQLEQPKTEQEVNLSAINTPPVMVASIPDAKIITEVIPAQAVIDTIPVDVTYIPAAQMSTQTASESTHTVTVQQEAPVAANEDTYMNFAIEQPEPIVSVADILDVQPTVTMVPTINTPTVSVADIPALPVATEFIPARTQVSANVQVTFAADDMQAVVLEEPVMTEQQLHGLKHYWSMYAQAWQEQQGVTAAKTAVGIGLTALVVYAVYKGGKWLYNHYYDAQRAAKKARKNKALKRIYKKLQLY